MVKNNPLMKVLKPLSIECLYRLITTSETRCVHNEQIKEVLTGISYMPMPQNVFRIFHYIFKIHA